MEENEMHQLARLEIERRWMAEREKDFFDLEQFRSAIRVDAFERIVVDARGSDFAIEGWPRKRAAAELEAGARMILCTTRKKRVRLFRHPAAALKVLKELGAKSVEVRLATWYPDQGSGWGYKRPDMSERLRFAHERARLGQ
jgi:hypothetical protein